jgi:sugar phosphate isomerase/epimerase
MDLGRLGHLTYCTNIHAGEALAEVRAGLEKHLAPIKAAVSPDRPLGVGLRLGHAAAEGLRDPAALASLKRYLDAGGYYVFTLNGFPYGPFHGRAVKENAYRPDWSEPERLAYTDHLADVLAALLPAGQAGSVSTVPCTFKPWADAARIDAVVENLIRHAAHLVGIARERGRTVTLALEPEPYCYLETIDEAVDFFASRLFSKAGIARLAALAGISGADAEAAMRRHLGLCYDVCHAAVEFEDAGASIERLRAAGIGIFKLQLSAALRVARFGAQSARALGEFAEPVYLHQVVRRANGALERYVDLPQALEKAGADGSEWRVHFHVPIFLECMEHFDTTQAFLAEILRLHRQAPISAHLEVETYTWDVLPAAYRGVALSAAIARELAWVRSQLGA